MESPEMHQFMEKVEKRLRQLLDDYDDSVITRSQITNHSLSENLDGLVLPSYLLNDEHDDDSLEKDDRRRTLTAVVHRLNDLKNLHENKVSTSQITELGEPSPTAASNALAIEAKELLAETGIDVNNAIISLAKERQSYRDCLKLYDACKALSISLSEESCASVMDVYSARDMFKEAEEVFDQHLTSGGTPSSRLWEAKIRTVAQSGNPDEALNIINRLEKTGVIVTCAMSVLSSFDP
jgi:pentatricopeptide repeat protein